MAEHEAEADDNRAGETEQLSLPAAEPAPKAPDPTVAINQLMVQLNAWQGSLPPPQLLQQYQHLIPRAPERLMALVEDQTRHRLDIEKGAVEHNRAQSRLGLICGTIVTLAAFAVCLALIVTGQSLTGFVGVLLTLSALLGALIGTKVLQAKEQKERLKLMAGELTRVISGEQ